MGPRLLVDALQTRAAARGNCIGLSAWNAYVELVPSLGDRRRRLTEVPDPFAKSRASAPRLLPR